MDLQEMKKNHRALGRQIKDAERDAREKVIAADLARSYVKVCCRDCSGTAELSEGGADAESDPPFGVPCRYCQGQGYLWARRWEGRIQHDMTHHRVFNSD